MLRSWGVELLPLLASVRPLVVPKYIRMHVSGLHDIMYSHNNIINLDIYRRTPYAWE